MQLLRQQAEFVGAAVSQDDAEDAEFGELPEISVVGVCTRCGARLVGTEMHVVERSRQAQPASDASLKLSCDSAADLSSRNRTIGGQNDQDFVAAGKHQVRDRLGVQYALGLVLGSKGWAGVGQHQDSDRVFGSEAEIAQDASLDRGGCCR